MCGRARPKRVRTKVQIPETHNTLAAFEAFKYDEVRVNLLKAKIGSLDGDCQGNKQALYDKLLALLKQEEVDAEIEEDGQTDDDIAVAERHSEAKEDAQNVGGMQADSGVEVSPAVACAEDAAE